MKVRFVTLRRMTVTIVLILGLLTGGMFASSRVVGNTVARAVGSTDAHATSSMTCKWDAPLVSTFCFQLGGSSNFVSWFRGYFDTTTRGQVVAIVFYGPSFGPGWHLWSYLYVPPHYNRYWIAPIVNYFRPGTYCAGVATRYTFQAICDSVHY